MSGKDAITKIAFFAMERANAKMDGTLSNTLTQPASSNLFIAGN